MTDLLGENLLLLLLLLKKAGSARLRESDIHHISTKTPAPQYQPIDRKKRNGKFLDCIIIIIKKYWKCKAGRERLTPYQSEDPNPTTPTHRMKEEKGKTAGDRK